MAERRRVIVLGLVAVVVLVAVRGASFLTDHRDVIASTPTPMALGPGTPVELPPGSQACMDNVTLGPDSQVARFGIADTFGRPGPPLVVSAASGGYHLHAPIAG